MSEPVFKIGGVSVYTLLSLAPMDGYTDSPFRRMAKKHGAGLLFTEFINAIDVVAGNAIVEKKMLFHSEERPIGFQLFDNRADRLLEAARIVIARFSPDFIDINLACPNRRVVARGAGAALLRDLAAAGHMVSMLARSLAIPVTAKIRLGEDDSQLNYLDAARVIEQSGAQCITVHARTTRQGMRGKVNWDAIAEIKAAARIPIIGNGDVHSPVNIVALHNLTGCDGVMIGRAAVGNPWIFSNREKSDVKTEEIRYTIQEHLDLSLSHYGKDKGLTLFRKHAREYLKGRISSALQSDLLTTLDVQHFLDIIAAL